jgi:Bacteriophage tail sheath protein
MISLAAGTPDDALKMLKDALVGDLPASTNISLYRLGTKRTAGSLKTATPGVNGTTLPGAAELIGNGGDDPKALGRLEKIDLFTLLAIPDCTRAKPDDPFTLALSDAEQAQIWSEALSICAARRASCWLNRRPPCALRPRRSAGNPRPWACAASRRGVFPASARSDPLDRFRLRTVLRRFPVYGRLLRQERSTALMRSPVNGSISPSGEPPATSRKVCSASKVGRVRTQRRTALGTDPHERPRLHAESVSAGCIRRQ